MRRLALCLVVMTLTSCPGLGTMMRNYGYKDIRPASSLFAPGTIVWVRNRSPFQAGVICTANEALGSDFTPIASGTMNAAIKKYAKKGFTFEAEFLSQVSSDNVLSAISSMQMKLTNPKIYEVHDTEIRKRVRTGSINPWCLDAIAARREEGYRVTMISSALQGDISYTVDWNSTIKLTAEAKVAALKNLSVQMGIDTSSVSETSFTADGLYLGIIEDRNLARLFAASPDQVNRIPKRASAPVLKKAETVDIPDPAASDYSGSPDLPDVTWLPPVSSASGVSSRPQKQPTYDTPADASSAPIASGPALANAGQIPDAFDGAGVPGVFDSGASNPSTSDDPSAPSTDSGELNSDDANPPADDDETSATPAANDASGQDSGATEPSDDETEGSDTSSRPASVVGPPPSKGGRSSADSADRQTVVGLPPSKGHRGAGNKGAAAAAQPVNDSTGVAATDDDDDEEDAGKPVPPLVPSKRISIVPREYVVDTAHNGHGHGRAGIQGAAPGEGIRASRLPLPSVAEDEDADATVPEPSTPSKVTPRTQQVPRPRPTTQMPDSSQAARRYGHGSNPYRNSSAPASARSDGGTQTEPQATKPASRNSASPQDSGQSGAPQQTQAPSAASKPRPHPRVGGTRPVTGLPQSSGHNDDRRRSDTHPGYF